VLVATASYEITRQQWQWQCSGSALSSQNPNPNHQTSNQKPAPALSAQRSALSAQCAVAAAVRFNNFN
jgi:hypothetical protein